MVELYAQMDSSLLIVIVRFIVCLLLMAVQWYVFRAATRMIRSMSLAPRREKLLVSAAFTFILLINIPLVVFMIEGFIRPRGMLFFAPPQSYESLVRPFAYAFFVWTFGSILFAVAAPLVMALFAAIQFLRRRRSRPDATGTVTALDFSRRRFLQAALAGAATMPFAVSAYGAVAARFRKVVERVVVPIAGLPPQLDGLTIAQLSDIHSGLFMTESQMREYVEIANGLAPDIIALTGDFVATSKNQTPAFLRAISALKAKHGVYGCLGNHDIFTDSEGMVERGFQSAGFKLLRNQNHVIEIEGARLNIIGVDYIGSRFRTRTFEEALEGIPLDGTTILLMHSPKLFPRAAKAGIDLTLSGHTHGGQIALSFGDFILTPVRLDTMFIAGLFKIDNSHLYVNRGLGTTGPPIRINAPPEITHITLRAV
jgi:predicted MPP superfamily phosphohydrolase